MNWRNDKTLQLEDRDPEANNLPMHLPIIPSSIRIYSFLSFLLTKKMKTVASVNPLEFFFFLSGARGIISIITPITRGIKDYTFEQRFRIFQSNIRSCTIRFNPRSTDPSSNGGVFNQRAHEIPPKIRKHFSSPQLFDLSTIQLYLTARIQIFVQ